MTTANGNSHPTLRRRVAKSWLTAYVICAGFALSVVPGFELHLLAPLCAGVAGVLWFKQPASKKALASCGALAFASGFAARKLAYEDQGLTPGVTLTMLVIGAMALICAFVVFDSENEAPRAPDLPS